MAPHVRAPRHGLDHGLGLTGAPVGHGDLTRFQCEVLQALARPLISERDARQAQRHQIHAQVHPILCGASTWLLAAAAVDDQKPVRPR
jgi:hypothetical protein